MTFKSEEAKETSLEKCRREENPKFEAREENVQTYTNSNNMHKHTKKPKQRHTEHF